MAGLEGYSGRIPASQQFAAIAYLRWRLFANSFKRKGGVGELIARIVLYPILFVFILGPSIGAGVGSWAAVAKGHLSVLSAIFWGVTLLQVFVSVNLSAPNLSFDPESLIRFPVTLSRYLLIRLGLGLLSPSTVIGTCSLLAAALGVSIARPSLGAIAFVAASALAVTNMLFIRMIFAWIDRWLSTRRAREIFTGLIIVFSIAIQWANVTFNPGFNSRHHDMAESKRKLALLKHFYHSSEVITSHFPAGAAGTSIVQWAQGNFVPSILGIVLILLFAGIFLTVFAWRMSREYRGESLSDSGSIGRPQEMVPAQRPVPLEATAAPVVPTAFEAPQASEFRQTFNASFYKEWIYVRRNTAQLYGMLAPLAMVFIFAGKMGSISHRSMWTFPGAIAYATLGIAALSYNVFGLDAEGVQFYFLAPVRMQTVMFAKNVFEFAISLFELVVVYVVLSYIATAPPPLVVAETSCWLVFAMFVNVTVGNRRSITAPKKQDPSKVSRRQASQLSAMISLGVILLVAGIGAGLVLAGEYLDAPLLPLGVLAVLAIAAGVFYFAGLKTLDPLAARNRETMIEELCKAS